MKFDTDYDDKGEGNAHYDELKKEVEAQTMVNRQEFEGLDDALRVEYEGTVEISKESQMIFINTC